MAPYKSSNNFLITAIGALGLAALAVTGAYMLPMTAKNKKEPKAAVVHHEKKQVFYNNTIVHNSNGIILEMLASDKVPETWSGINLKIEPQISRQWAQYKPVSITIPELNYIAPFPAEDGATGAKVTFAKPQSLEERIMFMVTGNIMMPGENRHLPKILFNKYVQVKDIEGPLY